MKKPSLPSAVNSHKEKYSEKVNPSTQKTRKSQRAKSKTENNNVLISAVVSSYLLTHLHHVLQRAEYLADKEGRFSQASNFAQLRKVLCMDARSMKDASALGLRDSDLDKLKKSNIGPKAA